MEPDSCCGQEEYNASKQCCNVDGGVRRLGSIEKNECKGKSANGEDEEEEDAVDERYFYYGVSDRIIFDANGLFVHRQLIVLFVNIFYASIFVLFPRSV